MRTFCAIEAAIGLTGIVLINGLLHAPQATGPWIALVVGLHFFGLADVWRMADPGLGDTEQRVLEAMCRGVKDEIGARDLGMSVRTYRRYVAELLQTLDAASRPQAALLARERGWV